MANDPNTIQYVIQEDGFWYIASKDRTPGVPGITVSSKGIANGLSTEYNDGFDFGPDSYDPTSTANPPYTQTSGSLEAINYIFSNGGGKVYFKKGIYNISTPATALTSGNAFLYIPENPITNPAISITLEGEVAPNSPNSPAAPVPIQEVIFNYTNPNYNDVWLFEASPDYSQSQNIRLTMKNIHFQEPPASSTNPIILGIDYRTVSTVELENVAVIVDAEFDSGAPTTAPIPDPLSLSPYSVGLSTTSQNWGNGINYLNNVIIYGYTVGITISGQIEVDNLSLGYCNYAVVDNGSDNMHIINRLNTNNCVHTFGFNGGKHTVGFKGLQLSQNGNSGVWMQYVNDLDLSPGQASGTTFSIYGYMEFASYLPTINFSAISAIYGYIKTFAGIAQSSPAVPASGTAQQNTNPYAVDVYVYGGDVTEIQITRNGNVYTVLSVSTAIAMSGQVYKLNPTDSITITYSTAPSWEWLSD